MDAEHRGLSISRHPFVHCAAVAGLGLAARALTSTQLSLHHELLLESITFRDRIVSHLALYVSGL
jgi:hypothetical protein